MSNKNNMFIVIWLVGKCVEIEDDSLCFSQLGIFLLENPMW